MERVDREPGVQGPEAGDPWVELVRSDRLVLFCIRCGNELGPKPVQPVVMFPDSPRPSALGRACVSCLRAHALALADAIEDHVEWLTGVAADLTRIARLARIGQFRRPSLADWQAANEIGLGGSRVLE